MFLKLPETKLFGTSLGTNRASRENVAEESDEGITENNKIKCNREIIVR